MVTFLFLFAPTVVLIAVLIIQRFQPKRDSENLTEHVIADGRVEPRFGAVNDNTAREPDPAILMDPQVTMTG